MRWRSWEGTASRREKTTLCTTSCPEKSGILMTTTFKYCPLASIISFNPFAIFFYSEKLWERSRTWTLLHLTGWQLLVQDNKLLPCTPSSIVALWNTLKLLMFNPSNTVDTWHSISRVDMSAAFLEKLWNIGIIPTKWSLENCDKVPAFKHSNIYHGIWKN